MLTGNKLFYSILFYKQYSVNICDYICYAICDVHDVFFNNIIVINIVLNLCPKQGTGRATCWQIYRDESIFVQKYDLVQVRQRSNQSMMVRIIFGVYGIYCVSMDMSSDFGTKVLVISGATATITDSLSPRRRLFMKSGKFSHEIIGLF